MSTHSTSFPAHACNLLLQVEIITQVFFHGSLFPCHGPILSAQGANKVVSDSPGLLDFAIGLVIFVLNLLDGQLPFFGEIQITEGL